jgi:hypothetical protein
MAGGVSRAGFSVQAPAQDTPPVIGAEVHG